MKIVGSHTGAYEVRVKLFEGEEIQLGCKNFSDLDIVLDPGEAPPSGEFYDILPEYCPEFPHIRESTLVVPDNYQYLCYPLILRLQRKKRYRDLFLSNKKSAQVFSHSGRLLDEFIFDLDYVPSPYFRYFSKLMKGWGMRNGFIRPSKCMSCNPRSS